MTGWPIPLDDCCEVGDDFEAKSGEFYNAYRSYCLQMGEYTRSTTDFYSALESTGVVRKRTRTGVIIYGLKLKSEFED